LIRDRITELVHLRVWQLTQALAVEGCRWGNTQSPPSRSTFKP
jgi:hypothetical protein